MVQSFLVQMITMPAILRGRAFKENVDMDELISKRALIEYYCKRDCGMTREECTIGDCHEIGLIEEFPSALGTNLAEVGTDVPDINVGELISRRAAIDAINRAVTKEAARWSVEELPSAQPKRGKWERHYSRPNVYADLFWHCSECGYRSSDNWADKFNFCPHCGADMRGDKNA